MPVVPVAGTDKRQAVDAERGFVQTARAVLGQRGDFVGNGGLEEAVVLARSPRSSRKRATSSGRRRRRSLI
jgi:hypothetical protein